MDLSNKTLYRALSVLASAVMLLTACGSDDDSSSKKSKTKDSDSSVSDGSQAGSSAEGKDSENEPEPSVVLTPEELALRDYAEIVKQEETRCGRMYFLDENMLTASGVKYLALSDLDKDGSDELIMISSDFSSSEAPALRIYTHDGVKADCVFKGDTFSDNVDIIPLDIWQGEDDGNIYYASGSAMSGEWKMVSVKDGAALEYKYTNDEYFAYRNTNPPEGVLTLGGKTYKRISSQPIYDCMPPKAEDKEAMVSQVNTTRVKLGLGTLAETEASLSEAERFAEAVVNSEHLWLGIYNKMPNGTKDKPECWVQDVDFDGENEFIIGGFNMQTQGGIGYSVYKVRDGRLIKQVESFYKDRRSEYDAKRIPSMAACVRDSQATDGHGFEAIGGEVLKKDDGKYLLVLPAIYSYIAEGYCLMSYTFAEDAAELLNVGGFSYETKDMQSYGFGKDFNITKAQLKNKMKDFFGSLKHCDITTGVIPCTEAVKDITEANKGDYICGCYNNLTRAERIEALKSSYNAYSLTETEHPSTCYGIFNEDMLRITGS